MDDKIIEAVSETLKEEEDILALFLFGSRARKDNKTESDYDFYIILDKNTKDSLREDEISKKVLAITKRFKADIHLTFQYLFILDEDKSLMLKISNEGKILFSKECLIVPYKQFGLQRYFICKWNLDKKIFKGKNKEAEMRTSKLMISRMLYGYVQAYLYKGQKKELKKAGVIDNKAMFGEKETIVILDSMFHHIKHLIESKNGTIKIINMCYIPTENIEIDKYNGKIKLEKFIRKDKNLREELFVKSVKPFDIDKIYVRYDYKGKSSHTIQNIKTLPEDVQNNIISKKECKFV